MGNKLLNQILVGTVAALISSQILAMVKKKKEPVVVEPENPVDLEPNDVLGEHVDLNDGDGDTETNSTLEPTNSSLNPSGSV